MLMHCFATIHQSQLVGLGDYRKTPTTNPGVSLEWDAGSLKQIQDPVSSSGVYKTNTGSMIPMFANIFNTWTGHGTCFVRCAVGGTSILAENDQGNGNWSPTGSLFDDSVTRIQAMLAAVAAAGHTVASFHIISSGGYADAKQGNALETYRAANAALVGRYRTALGRNDIKIYQELMYAPIGSDSQQTRDNCLYIRDQQQLSAIDNPGIKIAFTDSTSYDTSWLNADRLHYNQAGLNNMGRRFAEYIAEDLGFADPNYIPPTPGTNTSLVGRVLLMNGPKPAVPRDFGPGTYTWTVPYGFGTNFNLQAVGHGGKGGNGGVGLKGGAGGGGAYAQIYENLVPGEQLTVEVGPTAGITRIRRVSDGTTLILAAAGTAGTDGNPNGDGAGGSAAGSVGDVTTSGQAGGVSGIDNGGNGAAPLGAAGGTYPPAGGNGNPGQSPGGGGSAAGAGPSNIGGAGGAGLIRITAV